VRVPDLYVVKEGPDRPVSWGDTITYTISWGNTGRAAAPNVTLSDTFPPGVVYVSDTSGWAHSTPRPGTVVWQVEPNPLPTDTHGSFVVTAMVQQDPAMVTPMINRVRIQSDFEDGNLLDNVWDEATDLRLPDLAVDKTGPLTVTTRAEMVYAISYWNEGDQVASGVVITDRLPVGVDYLSDDSGLIHSEPAPGTHVWRLPSDLGPEEGGSFEVRARVGVYGRTGSELANRVAIGGDTPERSMANNEARWFSTVDRRYLYYGPSVYMR